MIRRRWFLPVTVVIAALVGSCAQTSWPQSLAKDASSQEAAVIESMATKVGFENDGNFNRVQTSRVRVQTDAGVKAWGILSFPFQSATQIVEIDYVRVHKVDGSTIVTPPDNIQDLDSEITRSAPFYSDLREKHVAVKGLGKGDSLEYGAHWHTTKPLIPGQFWFEYNFHHEGIVLSERVEIKVPEARAVKVKGPQTTQTVTTESGSRIYGWTYSKLENTKEPENDQKKQAEAALGRLPAPDVQISSFQTWDEVGRWYWNLQKDRIEPTAAVRAKATELTKGMTDDAAKLRALYSFVSTQYRYIGIAFGIGRYQPHAAEDVLSNNYGDCKDKHTLLASLLQAAGIPLYPALISSSQKLDAEVPSPAQFDHVIGYLPQGKNKDAVWLDTTIEVAPFGLLVASLRDKQALVMSGDKSIQLVTTPANAPIPSTEVFKIEGKLGGDGTLEAKIEDTSQGDSEVILRSVFRQVPEPNWKELVQRISYGLGFSGTVSDVSASQPEAVNGPFHFAYSYNRKDYPDWKSSQRFTVPGLPFSMPPVRDDSSYPIWLGSPMEFVSDSKVEIPSGQHSQTPSNVDLKYDFAEYHAAYSQENGVLIAKRRLVTKQREIPVAKFEDYRKFIKNMDDDVNQYVQTWSLSGSALPKGPVTPDAQPPAAFASPLGDIRALSDSGDIRALSESRSSEANRLEAEARNEMAKHDTQAAVSSLYRAVSEDAKFTRAWVMLGVSLFAQKQTDAATDAFHKAMAADPSLPAIPKALGYGLMSVSKFEDAVPVWRDYIKAKPADVDGPGNLGFCLLKLKQYPEAAAAYEEAVKIGGDRASLQARLGSVYLLAGERDKAAAAFAKLVEVDPQGKTFNDVAYQMANEDLKLPTALDYAKKAVRSAEDDSQKIVLPNMKVEDLKKIFKVAAYWDTLGWVDERMSNLEEAELYLRASWKLTQDGVVAGHLCHLYKREHKDGLAVEMCRMAISRMSMSQQIELNQYKTELDAAQENLNHLPGGKATSKAAGDGSDPIVRERIFKLPRFLQGTESAEFFVLLGSDGKSKKFKVEDVQFISGSDRMRLQGKQVRAIDFNVPAPDQNPTRFVQRGILGCYQYTGCSFVLLDPSSVTSLN
jgi:tetratricopeptide (TPR) repeat protein